MEEEAGRRPSEGAGAGADLGESPARLLDAEAVAAEVHAAVRGLHHQPHGRARRRHDPLEVEGIAVVPPGVEGELVHPFLVGVEGVHGAPVDALLQAVLHDEVRQLRGRLPQPRPQGLALDHGQALPDLEQIGVVLRPSAELAVGHQPVVQPPPGDAGLLLPVLPDQDRPAGRPRLPGQDRRRQGLVSVHVLVDPVVVPGDHGIARRQHAGGLHRLQQLGQRGPVALDRRAGGDLLPHRGPALQVHPRPGLAHGGKQAAQEEPPPGHRLGQGLRARHRVRPQLHRREPAGASGLDRHPDPRLRGEGSRHPRGPRPLVPRRQEDLVGQIETCHVAARPLEAEVDG